jgi:hypothetical protein
MLKREEKIMGKCETKIEKVEFDFTDDQLTKVTVHIDFWGDCPIQLKRVYTNKFPARRPAIELMEKELPNYLDWD